MSGFVDGPPYFFRCKKCEHRFTRAVRLGLLCPKCHSMRVEKDRLVSK